MDVKSALDAQSQYGQHLGRIDLEDPEIVREEVAKHRWWHKIDLGNGIVTPAARGGGASDMIPLLKLPDLRGKSVLDVGAWDGALSFHAERMGATVTALDMARPPTFDLASRVLNSTVRYVEGDITTLDPEMLGQFDVVLCLGVIYHVPSPLEVLETVAAMTRELLIVETDTAKNVSPNPMAVFVMRPEQYATDKNKYVPNYWLPNSACCQAMLQVCGFNRVEQVYGPRTAVSRFEQIRRYMPALFGRAATGYGGRAVFHASR